MSANTFLRITELDFPAIKQNLKDFLRSQDTFSDYDFEGSALNVLLDVLAYNTHYNGMYVQMVGNEMFLDTAQIRNAVVSHVKTLNYIPTSKRGAVAIVNVVVTPDDGDETQSLTLPKNTTFVSEAIDGTNYNFLTVSANVTTKSSNTFTFQNVQLKEGERLTYRFNATSANPTRRFTIPSPDIDTSTLDIAVQISEANTDQTTYTIADDITEITANSTVYFLEEDVNGSYTVYFGDGYIGKKPIDGNIIVVSYAECNGEGANKANSFTSTAAIGGFSNVLVQPISSASGGADRESIDQIKFRAPKWYTTQNRAVTAKDYEILLTKDYPNIDAISVWGGEEEIPPQYGKVFIAIKPVDGFVITEAEKLRIIDEIIATRSIVTVIPEIVNPDYTYLLFKIHVHYNPALTNKTEDELKEIVRNTVVSYRDTDLNSFDVTHSQSKLHRLIDYADKSFTGNAIDTYMQKRVEIMANTSTNYILNFQNSLKRGGLLDKLYSYPAIRVRDNENIVREVYIEEVPQSFSGVDEIEIMSAGSGYLTAPTVTITGDGTGATATAKIVNGKVVSIDIVNRGSDYMVATVEITGGDGSGATAKAKLLSRFGQLRTYYLKSTGEKVIVDSNAGEIDYDDGRVTLTSLDIINVAENNNYDSDIFTLNIQPNNEFISRSRDRITTLDENDSRSIQIVVEYHD